MTAPDPLAFPRPGDPRAIWVFAIDLDAEALARLTPQNLPDMLGAPMLDPTHIEVFPAGDIAEFGLARLLTQAHGMSEEIVAPDQPRLDELTAGIVLVHSRAADGLTGTFTPRPPLQFVGRYSVQHHLTPVLPHPAYASAEGIIPGPAGPVQPRSKLPRLLFVLMLIAAFGVIAWSLASPVSIRYNAPNQDGAPE